MATELYDLEPELSYPPPRSVRVAFREQAGRVLLILLLIGVCLATRSCAQDSVGSMRLLERSGKPARGKIISHSVQYNRQSADYKLTYKYVVNGKPYTFDENVDQDEYHNTPIGAPVLVTYLPTNPSTHAIGPVNASTIAATIVLWIFVGFWNALIFIIAVFAKEYSLRGRVKLLRNGVGTLGVVADMHTGRSSYRSLPRTYYRITCNYWAGQTPISKSFSVPFWFYNPLTVGSGVTIVYLPNSPWTSLPYRLITGVSIARKT